MDVIAGDVRTRRFKPVYLLYGEEHYLRDLAAKELVDASLDDDARDFNYSVFRAGEADVPTIASAMMSLPVLSERRVVVVSGLDSFSADDQKTLVGAIERMPRETLVILLATNVDQRTALFRSVSKMGRAVKFRRLYPNEAVRWLAGHARSRGISMDRAAQEYLVMALGPNLARLVTGVDKAYDYAGVALGQATKIALDHVRAVTSGEPECGVFEVVDAIGERNAPKAIASLRRVLSFGEPAVRILYLIARQARLILKTKTLQEQRMRAADIAKTLRLQEFVVRKCMAQARDFPMDDLELAFAALVEADVELKTSRAPDHVILEKLILRLCGDKTRGSQAASHTRS